VNAAASTIVPTSSPMATCWMKRPALSFAIGELARPRVRINVDRENLAHAEQLLQILADEGLAGKISLYIAQLVGVDNGLTALATRYGFATSSLPKPLGAPCTAVRVNELVVGSKGELYKCFESVGTRLEVIGDIRRYQEPNGCLENWPSSIAPVRLRSTGKEPGGSPLSECLLGTDEALGKVKEACRCRGMTHSQFSEHKRRFRPDGHRGLKDLPPVQKSHPWPCRRQLHLRLPVQLFLYNGGLVR
jgi:hypothetical protein